VNEALSRVSREYGVDDVERTCSVGAQIRGWNDGRKSLKKEERGVKDLQIYYFNNEILCCLRRM